MTAATPGDSSSAQSAPSGSSAGADSRPSDDQAAQSYFDDEIDGIHTRLDEHEGMLGEIQESIVHLYRSMNIGNRATARQSRGAPGAGASAGQPDAPVGASGLPGGPPPVAEPERNPTPSHWWYRPLFGR